MKSCIAVGFLALLIGCSEPHSGKSRASAPPQSGPDVFFVATNGSDGWSGHLPAPNRSRNDGPFGSLSRAQQAIRDYRRQTGATTPVTVYLRGGTYRFSEPLALTPADSATTWVAYPGEQPLLSGGRPIRGWKEVKVGDKPLWAVTLPEVSQGKWYFHELWVGGSRAVRARHPNRGYFEVDHLPDKTPNWTDGHTRFGFRPGDLKAWATATQAEVIVMTRWVESRLPVSAIDEQTHVVRFGKRSVFQLDRGDLYYVESALELLDQAGEWFLDRTTGTLYYWPRPGEKPDQVDVIAPVLAQVVRLEGQPDTGQFIDRLVFRGLTFSHTEWFFPTGFSSGKSKPVVWPEPAPEVGGFAQAAIGVPGAVWGQGVRESVFERCAFAHVGNYGLELARGCQRNRILQCEFSDLGAGGIKLGETAVRGPAAEQTRDNEISDCHIHDGGKMFHSAIGIWIGQSPDNRIVHNHIHDFFYTGISIGWTWGYGPAMATNNLVAFNRVHHIGKKSDGDGPILSDMGGIYTLSMQPGTRILNNLWHDIAGFRYGGWGIYFDEGSSSIVAASNVVYRTTHGGFHQHYGATNFVRNNIFAFARDHQVQRSRPESHPSFSFETNLVYFDSGVLLGGTWDGDKFKLDWNLYFDTRHAAAPESLPLGPATLAKWRERGHDRHSLFADPLFLAPLAGDFRLAPNSPANRIGFQAIDLSSVGVRAGRER